MDVAVKKAYSLIQKLQKKYGIRLPDKHRLRKKVLKNVEESEVFVSKEVVASHLQEDWCLLDQDGHLHRLPMTMIFLGREECDIVVKSQTVDKRHAVITFDHYLDRFKIKDLSTTNGTFVNEALIPEQEYVTLEHMDSLRLGYDSKVYHMECLPKSTLDNCTEQVLSPSDTIPEWAVRDDTHLAECEGCIAEQQITHTCEDHSNEEVDHNHLPETYPTDKISSCPNFGSNTWPRKRSRNVQNVTAVFNDKDLDNAGVTSTYDSYSNGDYVDQSQDRILRGKRAIPPNFPPELETVKKCTPLYGQPEWWGEDEVWQQGETIHGDARQQAGRPSSLTLIRGVEEHRLYSGIDLLQKEITPERDKERSPPRKMTTSMSKDSLSSHSASCQNTPDAPGEKYAVKIRGSSSDSLPEKDDITPTQKPLKCPDGGASMAFTVQLDDDTPKMKIQGSLSAFVPSKIRRSFRERSEKSKSSSKENSPCALEQEAPDIYPARQAKIEDLWNLENSNNNKRPRSTDAVLTPVEGEKQGSIPVKDPKTPKTKKNKITSFAKPKNASKTKNGSKAHCTSQVSDSATYLIDRMFGKDQNVMKDDSLQDIVSPFTEHILYKEAAQFNKNIRNKKEEKAEEKTEEKTIKNNDIRTYKIVKSKIFTNLSQNEDLSPEVEVKEDPDLEVKPTVEEGDGNSEAGTYTIDGEETSKAEKDARKNIDKVFGIAENDDVSINRPVIAGSRSPTNAREVTLDQLKREVEELEIKWGQKQIVDSLEVDIGSEKMPDVDIGNEELDYESLVVSVPSTAPEWVSQWAALTNQKARNITDSIELMSPNSLALLSEKESMEKSPLSQKQSSGLSRKRPGTGRRLPSIPPDRSSPSSSECSSKVSGKSPGSRNSPISIKPKTVKISSHVATHYQDSNSESVSRTKFDNDSECITLVNGHSDIPNHTYSSSVASMETDVLLKDTETVMAAMEARMVTKSHPVQNSVHHKYAENNHQSDSDTETSSNVAVANGDDDYVKPTYYESPRQNLSKAKLKNDSITSRPQLAQTKSASARLSNIRVDKPSVLKRETTFTKNESVVSDVVSEVDHIDSGGNVSDMSSDYNESNQSFNRKGSKGKGTITNTRPNRAFQLRRQRAEEPDTPKSSSASTASGSTRLSSGSTSLNTSSRTSSKTRSRPSSMILTSDRRLDSAKSEASLGAQIVKKSQDNLKSQTLDRKDGGRHSLRMLRTKSSSDAVLNTGTESTSSRKAKFKTLKSNLKTTTSTSDSYGLSVTGVRSNNSTPSQPSSRSNSPKSAERNAWRRRKQYDPRKAVAEAKAKAKVKEVNEVKASTTYAAAAAVNSTNKRMGRSQSFTNSSDLARSYSSHRSKEESTSSAEDLSRVTSEASDTFDEHGPKRSFMPYSNPLQHSRLYHSADEEDIRLVKSTQDLSRSMLGSNPNMSAFTPPPPKSASPVSPPPPNQHYHRRSFDVQDINNGFYHGTLSQKYSDTSLIQSYDNIIVSSIYQLSLKLKTAMNRTMQKLRESQRLDSSSPSPIDDLLNTSTGSDMPAWKSANQELAGILKNLRKIEHYVHVVDTVLFPDDDQSTEVSGLSRGEKRRYLQEIERIRSELAGFQPIENADVWKAPSPHEDQVESDCEELGGDDYY